MAFSKQKKSRRSKSATEVADLIERFVEGRSLYPQEWNDFVESSQHDPNIDTFRKRCDQLDPLVNRPSAPDPEAVAELRSMIAALRSSGGSPPNLGRPMSE